MVLIVDACHSTAAVEGHEFKPARWALVVWANCHDKGMRILTATSRQRRARAQGHWIMALSCALTIDGLESQHADFKPQDKRSLCWRLEYESCAFEVDLEIASGRLSVSSVNDRSMR